MATLYDDALPITDQDLERMRQIYGLSAGNATPIAARPVLQPASGMTRNAATPPTNAAPVASPDPWKAAGTAPVLSPGEGALGNWLQQNPQPTYQAPKPMSRRAQVLRGILAPVAAFFGGAGSKNAEAGAALGRRIGPRGPEIAAQQNYNDSMQRWLQGLGAAQAQQKASDAVATAAAERERDQADAEKARADAQKDLNPPGKTTTPKQLTPEEQVLQALLTENNGGPQINPATGKPYTPLEAYQAMKQAGEKPPVAPKPNEEDEAISDYLQAHNLPATPANRDKARAAMRPATFADKYMPTRGAEAMEKPTTEYTNFLADVAATKENIANATNGSELASAIAPLQTALIVVGAGGVHRINMNEINRAGGAKMGSIARQVDTELKKAGTGQLPAATIREMQQLVDLFGRFKYRQYLQQARSNAKYFQMGDIPVMSEDGTEFIPLSQALKQIGIGGKRSEGAAGQGADQNAGAAPKTADDFLKKYSQ